MGYGPHGRRDFLKAMGLVALAAGSASRAEAFFADMSFPVRTVERDTFEFDSEDGIIRWKDSGEEEPYTLTVEGLVETPLELSYKDMRSLEAVEQVSDFHCVEGWSVKDVRWGGFRFGEITNMAKPLPDAKYAIFHSLGKTRSAPKRLDHYVESHPVDYLLEKKEKCLMALDMERRPLPLEHGAPLRLIAPFALGYKNIKFVTRVVFKEKAEPGWWTLVNPIYPIDAPVPKERLRKG